MESSEVAGSGGRSGVLTLAGLALLLIGVSFVKGAVEENEPRAARTGLLVFGGGGLGLMLLGWLRRL